MTPDLRDLLDQVPPEEIPEVMALLCARLGMALGKMMNGQMAAGNGNAQARAAQKDPEKLLTIDEACLRLPSVTRRQLLRRTRALRFRREFSRKKILFEESGLQKWIVSLGVDRKTS